MAVNQGVVLGFTPGGKRVVARPMNNRSIHEIVMEGGGKMPSRLIGFFAGLSECQRAFDQYILEYNEPKPQRRTKKQIELSED